jgi:hypothetical protein
MRNRIFKNKTLIDRIDRKIPIDHVTRNKLVTAPTKAATKQDSLIYNGSKLNERFQVLGAEII